MFSLSLWGSPHLSETESVPGSTTPPSSRVPLARSPPIHPCRSLPLAGTSSSLSQERFDRAARCGEVRERWRDELVARGSAGGGSRGIRTASKPQTTVKTFLSQDVKLSLPEDATFETPSAGRRETPCKGWGCGAGGGPARRADRRLPPSQLAGQRASTERTELARLTAGCVAFRTSSRSWAMTGEGVWRGCWLADAQAFRRLRSWRPQLQY